MDWEIAGLARACAGCGRTFAEEEDLFSGLRDEKTTFVRCDYCAACWEKADTGEFYSHWRTRAATRDKPPKRFVDDEVLLNFFQRLENETDEPKVNFRYVLGLLLLRKKLFKFKALRREADRQWLVLYDRREDRDHEVLNPELSEEQILSLTEECGKILNMAL